MLQGIVSNSRQIMVSLWVYLVLLLGFAASKAEGKGQEIIADTSRIILNYRAPYLKYVDTIHGKLKTARGISCMPLGFGKVILGVGATLYGHTPQDLENSKITWRFFNSGRSMAIARDLGTDADIAYMREVFSTFYAGPFHSFDRLVHIMHCHMMKALELPSHMTISDFRKYIERTNKKGHYINVRGENFETYARLIALNLFITYWYDTHIV